MLWEIGGYWGMGHFQNNGAAGGLDLRHLAAYFSLFLTNRHSLFGANCQSHCVRFSICAVRPVKNHYR